VSASLPDRNKVLQLRPRRPAAAADLDADEPASQMAITVRTQLSLLQGYADIMEGLSPELKTQILQVMAQKSQLSCLDSKGMQSRTPSLWTLINSR